jgi:hypothetical protein
MMIFGIFPPGLNGIALLACCSIWSKLGCLLPQPFNCTIIFKSNVACKSGAMTLSVMTLVTMVSIWAVLVLSRCLANNSLYLPAPSYGWPKMTKTRDGWSKILHFLGIKRNNIIVTNITLPSSWPEGAKYFGWRQALCDIVPNGFPKVLIEILSSFFFL